MIKYTPISNKELNSDNENLFGYVGYNLADNTVCGKSIGELDGYKMKVLLVESDADAETIEGFIRSTLNYGANRNAYIAYYCAENGIDVAQTLGFSEDENGKLCGEIPVLLAGSCCKNKK